MLTITPADLPSSEPDVAVLDRLAAFERFSLALVIAISVVNLCLDPFPEAGRHFVNNWHLMPPECAVITILFAIILRITGRRKSGWRYRAALAAAALIALFCAGVLAGNIEIALHRGISVLAIEPELHFLFPISMAPETAAGFTVLGVTMLLLRAQKRLSSIVADVVTAVLVLVVLILVSGHVLAVSRVFGPPERTVTASITMICLLLLTQAAFFQRANYGVFFILLGRGMGSKAARMFSPLLLLLPYLREAGRARFIDSGHMPPHYTTAILASINAIVVLFIVIFLARRINLLETEISELSLRDGLTGLYNIRGFRILAEQSLHMAHRSAQPFSVLFVDLDNLKQTNDLLGHQAGSGFLIETGEILKDTFRETDVIGRIGGDEFAVAGQFSHSSIALAAQRLEECAKYKNEIASREIGLAFSIGYITTEAAKHSTLEELLAKADEAMYEQKRRRKALLN